MIIKSPWVLKHLRALERLEAVENELRKLRDHWVGQRLANDLAAIRAELVAGIPWTGLRRGVTLARGNVVADEWIVWLNGRTLFAGEETKARAAYDQFQFVAAQVRAELGGEETDEVA